MDINERVNLYSRLKDYTRELEFTEYIGNNMHRLARVIVSATLDDKNDKDLSISADLPDLGIDTKTIVVVYPKKINIDI